MNIKLINEINPKFSPIEQILFNRGIQESNMKHYLYPSEYDINNYQKLGSDQIRAAAKALITAIANNETCLIIVDCDCDGYTSAALLINYFHELYPTWVENNVKWYMHDGKQHGLSDCINFAIDGGYNLVICPDASSNDYAEHYRLAEKGIPCIVLDHHEADRTDEHAIIINNQLSAYPNKDFSGVGVVYQFCRFLDNLLGKHNANNYLDLVALGNTADMMSLKSIETKYLINEGLLNENLRNPFIYHMVMKNDYSLKYTQKGYLTSIGVAFYIAPFVNAITRSGTLEEKQLIFESMLQFKAFQRLPSTKRGHAAGEEETLVEQATRVVTNVKARQTKAQDAGMELLERMIKEYDLLRYKVLVFLLNPGQIDRNIAGLCANKIMAKYQRPTCVLTKCELYEGDGVDLPWEPPKIKKIVYQGSARGYEKGGIDDFKAVCSSTGVVNYAQGHANAFGISIDKDNIDDFLNKTDEILSQFSGEVTYRCDYIWEPCQINTNVIMEIGRWDTLWGKDMDEPMICIKNLKLTPEQVTVYNKRGNTIRINAEGISFIKFLATDKMCEELTPSGWVEINIVGRADINKWNGQEYPQILIEDFEIIDRCDSAF